jgi:integrase
VTKRAKIIDEAAFEKVITRASSMENGQRNVVMLLLSHKAGLRAAEIAGLTWGDVLDANGNVSKEVLSIPPSIAKKGHGRDIPMHPRLHKELTKLYQSREKVKASDPLMYATYVPRMSANYVAVFIRNLYTQCGLIGCSSHSGRRTFITKAARMANDYACSLKDVQKIAGHKYLDTTEAYIEPSTNVGKMIANI